MRRREFLLKQQSYAILAEILRRLSFVCFNFIDEKEENEAEED